MCFCLYYIIALLSFRGTLEVLNSYRFNILLATLQMPKDFNNLHIHLHYVTCTFIWNICWIQIKLSPCNSAWKKREENALTYLPVCLLSLKAILRIFTMSCAFGAAEKKNKIKGQNYVLEKKLELMLPLMMMIYIFNFSLTVDLVSFLSSTVSHFASLLSRTVFLMFSTDFLLCFS